MNIVRSTAGDDSSQAAISSGEPFPLKLHILLEETEKRGLSSIISWEGTNAFQVHNKELFSEMVMPSYFESANYKTFQRNLNLWGFRTVSKGPRKGECSHALFVRGNPDLCRSMVRVRNKTNPPDRFYQQGSAAMSTGVSGNSGAAPPPTGSENIGGSLLQSMFAAAAAPPPVSSSTTASMTGLGAALAATLNAPNQQQQQLQQPQPNVAAPLLSAAAAANKQQSLAPALATLLQTLASHQSQQKLPSAVPAAAPQQNMFGQQQQHQQQPQLNPQMLQLLALQQQANAAMNSSNNSLNGAQQQHQQQHTAFRQPMHRMPTMSSISGGSSDTASSTQGAGGVPGMPTLASMLQQQPQPEAEPPTSPKKDQDDGSTRVVACRARGMAMEHNIHTAYFRITPDTAHGTDLVCSFPQCRNGGVKFLYCAYCKDAIARRSFRSQHMHTGECLPVMNYDKKRPAVAHDSEEQQQAQKKRMVRLGENESSGSASTTAASAAAVSRDNSDSDSGSKAEKPIMELMKKSWEDLLQQRLEHKSEADVSPWLMKVLALSNQYAAQFKEGNGNLQGNSS